MSQWRCSCDYQGGTVEHPLRGRGALTIDEVQPGMTLYIFSMRGDQLLGEFEVERIEEYEIGPSIFRGKHAVVGTLTLLDAKGRRCAELGFNLGLEPHAGGWYSEPSGAYCVDKTALEAAC